ncbi:MAG: diphosphate--fructose-6-phosphate 1-phosphotransferase [Candidatus Marinimicrobia bacterium]|jgi:pyrophosphate--fructose-6-phosphate 1-phosphotransferase|nr:diphosphate--fructose-6-phosphate 1-phosphotransferase [Candidatus Neomarinimicrobiota bacterium]
MNNISNLQKARYEYKPKLPNVLKNISLVKVVKGKLTSSISDADELKNIFTNTFGLPLINFEVGKKQNSEPINVAVILSGGQAPGGHNVIAGIFDSLKKLNNKSKLFGFLGGPSGLIDNEYIEMSGDLINEFRNTGGFDIIGSGRTKLEKEEQFEKVLVNLKKLNISALVIIGGDDSNTNAGILAEYYVKNNSGVQVIGVPKTIDGDLKNDMIEASFGFDTATKVYNELIGNIQRDANSAKKYWHFIKLMGRSASHIALECGLQTHANITIISEEVENKHYSLQDIVEYIANVIVKRSDAGKDFGDVIIPEGLIEFIPDMKKLISSINNLLEANKVEFEKINELEEKRKFVLSKLENDLRNTYAMLPKDIASQMIMERDPHGNVQVSLIETEKLLIELVGKKLSEYKKAGKYNGKFSARNHFFGYEGRCAAPTNFDADYTYALGYSATVLIAAKVTSYMVSIRNLSMESLKWLPGGVPLTSMMNIENRKGGNKPVIKKALVELEGKPFKELVANRSKWELENDYVYPGPIQYFGPSEIVDGRTRTLELEKSHAKD